MNNEKRATQMVKEIMTKGDVRNTLGVSSRYRSNIYADKNRIYSYGFHYMIAMYSQGKWFMNNMGYSTSTGRHTRHVSWALRTNNVDPKDIIWAPIPSEGSDGAIIQGALTGSLRQLDELKAQVKKTRKGSGNNLRILSEIANVKGTISRLVVMQEMTKEG